MEAECQAGEPGGAQRERRIRAAQGQQPGDEGKDCRKPAPLLARTIGDIAIDDIT